MKKYNVVLFLALPVLAACGGSGGGTGGSTSSSPNGHSMKPVLIDSYEPLSGDDRGPIDDIYVQDLTRDGVEEVVIAGRLTQPSTIEDWQEYDMQIYGWNSGSFKSETKTWFNNATNQILGTEPSVHFGDFDGDGHTDMSVAHSMDMAAYGPSYVYFNDGNRFDRRVGITHETNAHDSSVGDFNNDGFDDLLLGGDGMSISLGSADGTFKTLQSTNPNPYGSGIATGDFLNDGTVTFVATDRVNQNLWGLDLSGEELEINHLANLPKNRFELSKWDDERANTRYKDTVRVLAFDFNNDGIDDVVSFSTLGKNGEFHGYTEVQFIENDGSGNFADVTDEVLKEFDTEQHVSYNPRLVDVNGDGLLDIMMSEVTTSVLLQQNDGSFVERFKEDFDAYNQTIREQIAGQADGAEPENAIVTGPDGAKFLVSKVNEIDDFGGFEENKIFLSEIGGNGTITVATTVEALKNQWTWMTDEQASEILSLTASGSVDGVPVIDYTRAMAPIGELSLNLKNGQRIEQLLGHVTGLDLNSNKSVLATDDFNRTFSVDLSESVGDTVTGWHSYADITDPSTFNYSNRSANLVDGDTFSFKGTTLYHSDSDLSNYSLSLPHVKIRENLYLSATFSDIDFSPWVGMSGMWGEVESSEIIEGIVTFKKDQWVVNTGLMHTQTEITPGLINGVSDIYSVWGDIGWQDKSNNFGVYGGVDPYVISGSATISMPGSVNENGDLKFIDDEVSLINEENVYVRLHLENDLTENLNVSTSGIIRQNNKNSVSVNIDWDF